MSSTDPGPARGRTTDEDELAARQQDADVVAAGIESNFLTFRMLPQMVLPLGGIPLSVYFIVTAQDARLTFFVSIGIVLMAASVWLHIRSFRERQAAARAALRGEPYDRAGFSHPYLAWFLGLLGFAGPWYFMA